MLQKAFQITPIYREISEWDEETGYHMGVYLCLNKKKHEFTPNDEFIEPIEKYINKNNPALENLKNYWDTCEKNDNIGLVIILGDSKHKIKKKAEQAACKISIEKLS